MKLINDKPSFNNIQTHAVLPKLHPRSDTILGNSEKHENVTNYGKNANLPTIKKQETNAEERLIKNRSARHKHVSDIDREVEKVKSDWRALRTDGGWTQNKNYKNVRTRKLYDTLERMTLEIDKIQKLYLNPKSNQYLQRGEVKSELSFDEKAGKIKHMLFPKENKKIIDDKINNISNDTLKNSSLEVISSKDVCNKKIEKKSLFSNTQIQNTKSGTKLNNNLRLNKRNTGTNSSINLKKINSDIEQYLDKYINDIEKNSVSKKELEIKELDVPTDDDIANMLKKLNINSFDLYDIDNSEDFPQSFPQQEKLKSIKKENSIQTLDQKIENTKIKEVPTKMLSPKEDNNNPSTQYNDKINNDSSIQTKNMYKDNAFIEMGLHALNNNYPRNALCHVLQSEYLKKDTSLKPM